MAVYDCGLMPQPALERIHGSEVSDVRVKITTPRADPCLGLPQTFFSGNVFKKSAVPLRCEGGASY